MHICVSLRTYMLASTCENFMPYGMECTRLVTPRVRGRFEERAYTY